MDNQQIQTKSAPKDLEMIKQPKNFKQYFSIRKKKENRNHQARTKHRKHIFKKNTEFGKQPNRNYIMKIQSM